VFNIPDFNGLVVTLIGFSPLIVGLTVLFYIKNKQGKEKQTEPKKGLTAIFGLE